MKIVERRLERLEGRLAPQGRKPFLIVVTDAAKRLALNSSVCIQILREAGHLDTRSLCYVVDLGNIPDGLDAAELERHLREYGAPLGLSESRPEAVADIAEDFNLGGRGHRSFVKESGCRIRGR